MISVVASSITKKHNFVLLRGSFTLAMILSALNCKAAGSELYLAGYEMAKQSNYAFLGYIKPFEGSDLDNGFSNRVWVDYLNYQYNNGAQVVANAPGLSYSVLFNKTTERQSVGIGVGIQDRYTGYSPSQTNDIAGNKVTPTFSLRGIQQITSDVSMNVAGSYAPASGYWVRAALPINVVAYDTKMKTGPEYIIQGQNTVYQIQKFGWFISEIPIRDGFSGGFHLGYSKNNSQVQSIYGGITLVRYFE